MKQNIQKWSKLDRKSVPIRYDLGGIFQGVGGMGAGIGTLIMPGIGTAIGGLVGQGVSMLGGIVNNAKQKKDEQASQVQQKQAALQAQMSAMPQSGHGLTNPLGRAYGGYSTSFARRGFINPLGLPTNTLTTYSGGGTHNQNPLGGIPIGKNIKGRQNTVENGESSFNFPEGKYIFSNRLKLRK